MDLGLPGNLREVPTADDAILAESRALTEISTCLQETPSRPVIRAAAAMPAHNKPWPPAPAHYLPNSAREPREEWPTLRLGRAT